MTHRTTATKTPRKTINNLTSDDLDQLYRDLQQARASLAGTTARLREVSSERERARRIGVALENELAQIRRYAELTADSCRVQARETAEDVLQLLGSHPQIT